MNCPPDFVELTRQKPGDRSYVRAVSAEGIRINEDTYRSPVLVTPQRVVGPWKIETLSGLTPSQLQPILDEQPELVLLGTGPRQVFLPPELMMVFHRAGIGIEVMDTRAACRTFNVLVMEERKVLAALLPLDEATPGGEKD